MVSLKEALSQDENQILPVNDLSFAPGFRGTDSLAR